MASVYYHFTEPGIYSHTHWTTTAVSTPIFEITFDASLLGCKVHFIGRKRMRLPFTGRRSRVRVKQTFNDITDIYGDWTYSNDCALTPYSIVEQTLNLIDTDGILHIYNGNPEQGSGGCAYVEHQAYVEVSKKSVSNYLKFPRWQKTRYGMRPHY